MDLPEIGREGILGYARAVLHRRARVGVAFHAKAGEQPDGIGGRLRHRVSGAGADGDDARAGHAPGSLWPAALWARSGMRDLRSSSDDVTSSRTAFGRLLHPAISRIVRPQPRHQPVVASMAQTFTQGLSMGSTMGLLLVDGLRHHKMQFESCSPEAIIGGKYSLFASQGTPRMHISFTPADEAFRQEVRQFIAESYPKELKGRSRGEFSTKEDFLAWHKILFKQGWVAPSWPKQHGGTGWTSTQKYIFGEECAAADTPTTLPFGLAMVGPVIYTFGNDEQKAEHLPKILSGERWWCQQAKRSLNRRTWGRHICPLHTPASHNQASRQRAWFGAQNDGCSIPTPHQSRAPSSPRAGYGGPGITGGRAFAVWCPPHKSVRTSEGWCGSAGVRSPGTDSNSCEPYQHV